MSETKTPRTMMTTEHLNKMDQCRHLLEAPAPKVVGDLIEEVKRLQADLSRAVEVAVGALEESIRKMEHDEVQIDGEWGACRSLEEMEEDGSISFVIVDARKALAELKRIGQQNN